MSLIDHFYNIFPENIVFQILTYKAHPCAVLIKKDLQELRKKIGGFRDIAPKYHKYFKFNRNIYILKRKADIRRHKMLDYIRQVEPLLEKLRNKIDNNICNMDICGKLLHEHLNVCTNGCDYYNVSSYCGDSEDNGRCCHYNNIKTYKNYIHHYESEIVTYRQKYEEMQNKYHTASFKKFMTRLYGTIKEQ